MARARKAILVGAEMLSASVRSLRFRTADGSRVGHVAGQYLDLVVPTAKGLPFRRAYSIASAPDEGRPDEFELAVTRIKGGITSEALHELKMGSGVEFDRPRGTFVRPERDRAHPGLFVAAGTGLAPIRAMLSEDVRLAEGPPLVLLFGCRTENDALWRDELRAWEEKCPRFRLHVTLSRPADPWRGLVGHVQKHVQGLALSILPARTYVCGLSAMVDDVVRILEKGAAGLPRDSLHYETYD